MLCTYTDTTFSLQSHNELLLSFLSTAKATSFCKKEKKTNKKVAQVMTIARLWTRRSFYKPWVDEEARKCLLPCSPARCSEAGLFGLICFLQQKKRNKRVLGLVLYRTCCILQKLFWDWIFSTLSSARW